ncbi:MAG: hypothetical protein DRG11_06605 [Epsilonproteobacteria bacterium]|nr:MAG: hypothetical protein DRG11_06605 [Campylobacterota bacterium]
MKNLVKIVGLSAVVASVVYGGGYRIPEQSASSVALSGAYIANSSGASASYYNPANMSFNKNQTDMEVSLMHIGLTKIKYTDNNGVAANDGKSKAESFIVPTLFISTKDYAGIGLRYGLSITVPGGLSKRWDSPTQKASAEEFTLEVVELNPTVSYKINEQFAVGGGLRVVKTDGVVKSSGGVSRDLTGDSIDYGYNLGATYKPDETSNISATYRSNVDLTVEGDAKLYAGTALLYDDGASVTVPLPAVSTLAYSKSFGDTTVELNYDITHWSAYEELDFEYSSTVAAPLQPFFDDPIDKSWEDTTAIRLGVTHKLNKKLTLMAGYAKDENPVPEKTLGYELPDSDATLYSLGANWVIDDKSSVGFGYLLDIKEKREVKNDTIDGEFTDAKAHMMSFAYRTSF